MVLQNDAAINVATGCLPVVRVRDLDCAAILSVAIDRVVSRRLIRIGDVMFGRSRCRDGGAEHNRRGKRNFCLTEHCCISYWCGGRCSEANRTIDGLADVLAAAGRRTRWRSGHTKEKTTKRLCYSHRSMTTASFQITFS